MNEELEKYKTNCLELCRRLLGKLDENEEEAASFFGGDIYKAYLQATDEAKNKTRSIQGKIRNI